MTKGTKVWLWIALIMCVLTTIMNASEGRMVSVIIAIVSLAGLCILLFGQKKIGFYLMCICAILSCLYSIISQLGSSTGLVLTILMSIIGSALVPLITFLFIRKNMDKLK